MLPSIDRCLQHMLTGTHVVIFLPADEKEKFDPLGFRDAVIQGLDKAGPDLDAVSKFLDSAGSKLDYRRYGEALFDILIAGGLLGETCFTQVNCQCFIFVANCCPALQFQGAPLHRKLINLTRRSTVCLVPQRTWRP